MVVRQLFEDMLAQQQSAIGGSSSGGGAQTVEELAAGFLAIAVENMANAIKKISIERGYDVSEYVLGCFGGAGGQHACLVADALGISRIFCHQFAGVLSAFGMGLADVSASRQGSIEAALDAALVPTLDGALASLAAQAEAELHAQEIHAERIHTSRNVHLKYAGSDTAMLVPFGSVAEMIGSFEEAHRAQYGFIDTDKTHVVEAVSVEAVGAGEATDEMAPPAVTASSGTVPPPPQPSTRTVPATSQLARVRTFMAGHWHEATPVVDRATMVSGSAIDGPGIIIEETATTVVEPGWRAELDARGGLVLTRVVPLPAHVAVGTDVSPVMLEIFNNLVMSIAEQMGVVLQVPYHPLRLHSTRHDT